MRVLDVKTQTAANIKFPGYLGIISIELPEYRGKHTLTMFPLRWNFCPFPYPVWFFRESVAGGNLHGLCSKSCKVRGDCFTLPPARKNRMGYGNSEIERAKRAHSLFRDFRYRYICSRSSRLVYPFSPYTPEAPLKLNFIGNFNVCGSSRFQLVRACAQ